MFWYLKDVSVWLYMKFGRLWPVMFVFIVCFLFLGEILWLCYTFEGEFTYDVNNSVMSFGF